jgi:hypothetical protein
VQHSEVAGWADLKNDTKPVGSALISGSVEVAVRGLIKRCHGISALGAVEAFEVMDCAESSGRSDLKHGAVLGLASLLGRTVEVSVARQDKTGHGYGTVVLVETMQRGQGAGGRDFEDCAIEFVGAAP